jgi:hypothetical protein
VPLVVADQCPQAVAEEHWSGTTSGTQNRLPVPPAAKVLACQDALESHRAPIWRRTTRRTKWSLWVPCLMAEGRRLAYDPCFNRYQLGTIDGSPTRVEPQPKGKPGPPKG